MKLRSASRFLVLPPLVLSLLAPAAAGAETFNFFNGDGMGPTGGAGDVGPANHYPSSTIVSGLDGSTAKVTVTLLDLSSASADDIDALLVGPEGQQVMLMSDACGVGSSLANEFWTFDDDAPASLPDAGPCGLDQVASFKPTNYVGGSPEPDQFGAGGGISPPYGTALSDFDGSDPNGPWDLYIRDDQAGFDGFEVDGWLLTLEVEPSTPPAMGPAPTPRPTAKHTGKRARALARCKKRKTRKARTKCRGQAKKLPV